MPDLITKSLGLFKRGARERDLHPPRTPSDALDLSAPDVRSAPYEAYETLRQRHGSVVYLERHNFWIVLGEAEVRQVFAGGDLFSSDPYESIDPVLVGADGPGHGAARKLVAQQLDPAALRRVTEATERCARSLVSDRFDAVSQFAAPIARTASANLLGFGEDEIEALARMDREGQDSDRPFWALREGLVPLAPQASIFDRMIEHSAGKLQYAEAVSLVRFLWLASAITTERVVSRAVYLLAQDPALRDSVRDGNLPMNGFVEEVLRLYPPEHMMPRRAIVDVRLGEAEVRADDHLRLCLTAANRDPKAFAEPSLFNPRRAPNRHQSFGSGPHVCIGAALTRKTIPAVIAALLEEAPELHGPIGPVQHAATAEGYYLRSFEVARSNA